jgi:hypothetical protein
MTTQEFIDKALSADGLQDAIKKAELSDKIFEALTPAYKYTVKCGWGADLRNRYLIAEAVFEIQAGVIPNTLTPTEVVREFFDRL